MDHNQIMASGATLAAFKDTWAASVLSGSLIPGLRKERVQLLLMGEGGSSLCIFMAIVLLLMNGALAVLLGVEFGVATGTFVGEDRFQDEAQSKVSLVSGSMADQEGGNPVTALAKTIAMKLINIIGKYILRFVMKHLMAPLRWVATLKAVQEHQVPLLQFKALGKPLQLLHHARGYAEEDLGLLEMQVKAISHVTGRRNASADPPIRERKLHLRTPMARSRCWCADHGHPDHQQ